MSSYQSDVILSVPSTFLQNIPDNVILSIFKIVFKNFTFITFLVSFRDLMLGFNQISFITRQTFAGLGSLTTL